MLCTKCHSQRVQRSTVRTEGFAGGRRVGASVHVDACDDCGHQERVEGRFVPPEPGPYERCASCEAPLGESATKESLEELMGATRTVFTGVQNCSRCGYEESWFIRMVPDPHQRLAEALAG